MHVNQISIGRFHHFHLARQLEKRGLLENIWTGYPSFKLKDEQGIPKTKIQTFPWVHTPYMVRGRLGLSNWDKLNKQWEWIDREALDKYVAYNLNRPSIVLALSSCGLHSGIKNKSLGGKFICDRGSSHIKFQQNILTEEYEKWGLKFNGIDKRVIEKEELEYEIADLITVPSEFVRKSFIEMGVAEEKIRKIPYGARLERFKKDGNPNYKIFRVLWVGNVSIRKGFLYALEAFLKFSHPRKEFIVIGEIEPILLPLLKKRENDSVFYMGLVSNIGLPKWYSSAHVFVLPSIEEGLAMVQGEALACGCPVISTPNTGSEDLYCDRKEGFIVSVRSIEAIVEKLYQLADNEQLRQEMSHNAIKKVNSLGGWDNYGHQISDLVKNLTQ